MEAVLQCGVNNRHAKDSILKKMRKLLSTRHGHVTYFIDKENNDADTILHHRIQCVGKDHYVDDPENEHEGDQSDMVHRFRAGIWKLVDLQDLSLTKGCIDEESRTASIRSDNNQWKHLINSN